MQEDKEGVPESCAALAIVRKTIDNRVPIVVDGEDNRLPILYSIESVAERLSSLSPTTFGNSSLTTTRG